MTRGLMMKRLLWGIILVASVVCLVSSSVAAATSNTFQCPNGSIVYIGDDLATVKTKCDPPTSITRTPWVKGYTGYSDFAYYETVDVEEWVYDLGPTSFVMHLTFTNGVLVTIESGDYGH